MFFLFFTAEAERRTKR